MAKQLLLIIGLLIASLSTSAQWYICIDKDGYTNIRERPTVSSKTVDKAQKHELLFLTTALCEYDMLDVGEVPPNWLPVTKGNGITGYAHKKNIRSLDDMPKLYWKEGLRDTIACSNDTLSVAIVLKPFDQNTHDIDYATEDGQTYLKSVDGEWPKGLYQAFGGPASDDKEIKELIIQVNDKKYSLPIDAIKNYYNPRMVVFIGDSGELYIDIGVGDGGEAYSITLSVVNGKIVHAKPSELC